MKWRHQEEAKKKKEEDSQKSELERSTDDVRSLSPDMDIMGDDSGDMMVDDDVDDDDDDDDDRDIHVDDDEVVDNKMSLPFLVKPEVDVDRTDVSEKRRSDVTGNEPSAYGDTSENVDDLTINVKQKTTTSGCI